MRLLHITLAVSLIINTGSARPVEGEYYKKGVVVSAHPEASRVGLNILKKGGNAVDAAVAVQFALAVVYPNAGNIGGGGFLVYRGSDGSVSALDFREKAPAKSSRDMYLDEQGNVMSDKSVYGHLSAGVPGTVDGMVKASRKYSKLKWKELLEPSIALAEKGFAITAMQAAEMNRFRERFIKFNPAGTALVKDVGEWKEGDLLLQPELARTLKCIRNKGRAGFYEGKVAAAIVKEMQKGSGLISKEDLQNYEAIWRTPVTGMYKDYKAITMPPPSSGGIALLQLLQSVEAFPIKRWGHNGDSTVQLIVEAERRVYADRAAHLGDPDYYNVPQAQLLRPAYQETRLNNFTWAKATPSVDVQAGVFQPKESEETTHFSIVDDEGNAVSVTTTLNGSYGSLVVVPGAGFLLNNEMDDFSAKPGTPNMYGLVGGEANAIQPGKRMLSSMTPTILEKDDELFMVLGTPGGSTIITSVFQTILNVVEFDKGMQEAVAAKRFHHQWLPDEVYAEKGAIDSVTISLLENKGYKFVPRGAIGRVDAILKTQKGYTGGADPRGDDTCLGW